MKITDLITIQEFCTHYQIPKSFINSLYEYDLIEIVNYHETQHIEKNKINHIEKIMRLHFDLDINFEGIDVILKLLNDIESLKRELIGLQNKLELYKQ